MSFDYKKYLIKVQGGKEYLPVAARLIWFREDHPDWTIQTKPVEINVEKFFAVFHAEIIDREGKVIATGTKHENVKGFADYIEKAETGSIGRALAVAGYGTQFAPELEEGDRFADSPRESSGVQVSDNHCHGEGCGVELTNSQKQYSMQHFGEPLCPSCQKKAQNKDQKQPSVNEAIEQRQALTRDINATLKALKWGIDEWTQFLKLEFSMSVEQAKTLTDPNKGREILSKLKAHLPGAAGKTDSKAETADGKGTATGAGSDQAQKDRTALLRDINKAIGTLKWTEPTWTTFLANYQLDPKTYGAKADLLQLAQVRDDLKSEMGSKTAA